MKEFYSGRRVVVTGGAGFIGSHLVDALLKAGADVVVVDNLHSGMPSNLRQSAASIRFFEVDVRDREALSKTVEGVDMVFHLAGNASVPYSIENPSYDFEANVLGTYNVLQLLLDGRIGRVLFSSTAAVYGIPLYTPTDESHPLEPVSPYGASKLAAERIGVAYARSLGIDFLVARIFNTYGPRQRKYVMYDLLNKLHANPQHLEVLGDGSQIRDYSFVADTVNALMTIMRKGEKGNVYNISGNNPVTIRDLAQLLADVLRIDGHLNITYTGQSWKGDIPVMVANTEKIRLLGFEPQMRLHEGVEALFRWMEVEVWNDR